MTSRAGETVVSVAPTTLQRSSSGLITGTIALRLGETWFPEPDWSDFPVTVLTWWLHALTRPLSGRSTSVSCQFMEGPYAFVVARDADDRWDIAPVLDGHRRASIRVDGAAFVGSVERAGADVVAECERRGWTSDVAELRSAVAGVGVYRAI